MDTGLDGEVINDENLELYKAHFDTGNSLDIEITQFDDYGVSYEWHVGEMVYPADGKGWLESLAVAI
eukprot:scaffold669171_cov117-Prasinocladus_malaysianus.AAC.1